MSTEKHDRVPCRDIDTVTLRGGKILGDRIEAGLFDGGPAGGDIRGARGSRRKQSGERADRKHQPDALGGFRIINQNIPTIVTCDEIFKCDTATMRSLPEDGTVPSPVPPLFFRLRQGTIEQMSCHRNPFWMQLFTRGGSHKWRQ